MGSWASVTWLCAHVGCQRRRWRLTPQSPRCPLRAGLWQPRAVVASCLEVTPFLEHAVLAQAYPRLGLTTEGHRPVVASAATARP